MMPSLAIRVFDDPSVASVIRVLESTKNSPPGSEPVMLVGLDAATPLVHVTPPAHTA